MHLVLAWRNLWRNRRRTLITIASITFAVLLAVFVQALNQGSYDQMIDNVVRFHTGYLRLEDPLYEDEPSLDHAMPSDPSFEEAVRASHPDIDYVVPRIETFALAAGPEQTRGALVLGIDPEQEARLNAMPDRLVAGRMFEPGDGTAVLAEGLARRLELAVGDNLVLLGQGRFGTTAAGAFEVAGLMSHPLREMNDQAVYLSLPDAQWLLSMDGYVTSLLVMPAHARYTDAVAEAVEWRFGGPEIRVRTWPEMMPELLELIEFDRVTDNLTIGILYMVIGFGIFGTILTMTLERLREFGVLLSIGMRRRQLGFVVFLETFMISALGAAAGSVLGYPLMVFFNRRPIEFTGDAAELMMTMGIQPAIPTSTDPGILWMQGLVIFVLAFLICLYPIVKIARLNILDSART